MAKCRNCKNESESGIWVKSQFKDTPILLFCSEKCKEEFIKTKLNRIKTTYPKYYEKIKNVNKKDLSRYVL